MQSFEQHNNDDDDDDHHQHRHHDHAAGWQNDYHRAILLNNVGINLLQQQCYTQAMECLEHAATLMPYRLLDPVSPPSADATTTAPAAAVTTTTTTTSTTGSTAMTTTDTNTNSTTDTNTTTTDTNTTTTDTNTATSGEADVAVVSDVVMPQRQEDFGYHHLANPRPAKKCVALMDTLTITPCGMLIVGETHASNTNNTYSNCVMEAIIQVIPGAGIFFIVRMEDVVCTAEESATHDVTQPQPQQAVLTRQAAIATYNLGIACFCICKTIRVNGTEQRDSLKERFLQAALQYGRKSASVLLKQLRMMMQVEEQLQQQQQEEHSEQRKRTGSEMLEHEARLLLLECLTLVALHTYLQMLQEAQQKEHAMALYQQLVDVRRSALEHRYASDQSWAGIWNTLIRSGETAAAA